MKEDGKIWQDGQGHSCICSETDVKVICMTGGLRVKADLVEGSLEVKFPASDRCSSGGGKSQRQERVKGKNMKAHKKVRKRSCATLNTVFFPKVVRLKQRVRSHLVR